MSFAAFLWVLHDAISKWLMQDYSIYQVLLLRTVFSLLPILIVVRRGGDIAGCGEPGSGYVWAGDAWPSPASGSFSRWV